MDIKEKTILRAISMLSACGAEYHIKVEDKEYGKEIKAKARKRLASKYEHGALKRHMWDKIDGMDVGDVIEISIEPFDKASIQSSASVLANKAFGAGNYTTHINGKNLEVLRLA